MKVVANGLLIDGTGREPVQNGGVVIDDDGLVTSAGRLDDPPRGAEVIDVSGRTIMPGLIVCHVHLFAETKSMMDIA